MLWKLSKKKVNIGQNKIFLLDRKIELRTETAPSASQAKAFSLG